MTIDLSKLKAGDTVEFRCGGKAIVTDVSFDGLFYLFFGNNVSFCYFRNGDYCGDRVSAFDIRVSLFDIIAIHPAKVKRSGEIWYVIIEPKDGCNGSDKHKDLLIDVLPSLEDALRSCRSMVGFKPLAITNKTTWTEGDGLELLEDGK